MEPSIYTPSIYKGPGIYKNGAGGGGLDLYCILDMQKGTRGTTDNANWPYSWDGGGFTERICNKNVLQIPVGKKIKLKVDDGYLIALIDGTKHNEPFRDYSFHDEIEFIVEYGNLTITVRNLSGTGIMPADCNVYMYL